MTLSQQAPRLTVSTDQAESAVIFRPQFGCLKHRFWVSHHDDSKSGHTYVGGLHWTLCTVCVQSSMQSVMLIWIMGVKAQTTRYILSECITDVPTEKHLSSVGTILWASFWWINVHIFWAPNCMNGFPCYCFIQLPYLLQ